MLLFIGFKMLKYVLILFSFVMLSSCNSETPANLSNIPSVNSVELSIKVQSDKNYYLVIKSDSNEKIDFAKLKKIDKNSDVFDYFTLEKISNTSKILYYANKNQKITINNLSPATQYYADIIFSENDIKTIAFNTIAYEPTTQATNIAFKDATSGNLDLLWMDGNGTGAIVVLKKGTASAAKPVDGVVYTAGTFGDNKCLLGDSSYIVFSGIKKEGESVMIPNLAHDEYFVKVFAYNGEGKFINYLNDDAANNPRFKHTRIPAPQLNSLTSIGNNAFKLNWSDIKKANTYIIDVAYDENFTNLVEFYNNSDIGKLVEFEFMLPENAKSGKIYVRLRAKDDITESTFSNVLEHNISNR